MKNLFLIFLGLSFTNFTHAKEIGTIQIQKGDTATLKVLNCKSSEYGVIKSIKEFQSYDSGEIEVGKVKAACLPKTCVYEYWNVASILGHSYATITLKPGGKLLMELDSQEATQTALKELVRSGVCAKTMRDFTHGAYL